MGSSLGGIISLAAAEQHASTFGRVAAVSPSLWWNNGSVINRWSARAPAVDRLWVDMGDRERAGLCDALRHGVTAGFAFGVDQHHQDIGFERCGCG